MSPTAMPTPTSTSPQEKTPIKKPVQSKAVGFTIPSEIKFDNLAMERKHKLERLACAFRIFARLGLDEGVAGHLTLRDPEHTDCFWVNPFGHPFALMQVSDLLLIDHSGAIISGGKPELQFYNRAAFAIHAQLHKARPDVNAACHSHSVYGKAFSTLGKNLDIITQDHCAFHNDVMLYPNFGGVVLDEQEGENIANFLGKKKGLIMQNHGILTVATTIEAAVGWFIQLERACHVQLLADAAGTTHKIDDEEAQFTYESTGSDRAGAFWASPYFKMAEIDSKGDHKL